jgi:Rod binding domain-containing protein
MTEPLFTPAAVTVGQKVDRTSVDPKARAAAEDFEAVFLSQLLATMTQDLAAAGGFGSGEGEEAFQDMYTQELGKIISRSGGIGVADVVLQEILKLQEVE